MSNPNNGKEATMTNIIKLRKIEWLKEDPFYVDYIKDEKGKIVTPYAVVTTFGPRGLYTLPIGFKEYNEATAMIERIEKHGQIDLDKWVEGAPGTRPWGWDATPRKIKRWTFPIRKKSA